MGQRHKHADVIIAWAEGKDVQVWDGLNNKWCDLTLKDPNFCGKSYRIKPPAKKYRVALFNDYTSVCTADNMKDASSYEKDSGFIRWLTDWVEYEE